uniref:Gustatory receptor n=1 Tax=Tribolium castaneum TaxID=7070 RepID=B8PUN4_TRICA|nr:gustatory receptor [Tribolium castaneum]
MSLIVTHPFTLVVTVAKIFGLLSAKTPSKTNWRLFLYSLVLVVLYVAILVLRFLGNQEKTEQSLSKVVTYLHVLCYVAVFSANICSNWFNSKSFIRGLIRLEFFDYQIKPAVEIDYNNMKKRFYASFGVFWVIFFVVATVDFVGEIVLAKLDLITWISFYFPFFYNSFGLFIIYSTLFLVSERFSCLEAILIKILREESLLDLKQFTLLFLELNEICNSMVANFSLQIATTFLMVFVIVTTNLYLMLKMHLNTIQFVLNVNFFLVHFGQIVLIIFVFYSVNKKIREIVSLSPRIFSVNGKTKTSLKEVSFVLEIGENQLIF